MPDGIGILSTIPFVGTARQQAFERGLGDVPGLYRAQIHDDLGYGQPLQDEVGVLNGNGQVTLIVCAGGLIAEQAAFNSPKDNISLVGNPPAGSGGHHRGRIDMQSVAANQLRRVYLNTRHNIPFDEHCLFSNTASAMYPNERTTAGGEERLGGKLKLWVLPRQIRLRKLEASSQLGSG